MHSPSIPEHVVPCWHVGMLSSKRFNNARSDLGPSYTLHHPKNPNQTIQTSSMGIKVSTGFTQTAKYIQYQRCNAGVWQELKHREQIAIAHTRLKPNCFNCSIKSRHHHENQR